MQTLLNNGRMKESILYKGIQLDDDLISGVRTDQLSEEHISGISSF